MPGKIEEFKFVFSNDYSLPTQLSNISFFGGNGQRVGPLVIRNPMGINPPNEDCAKLLVEEGKWLDKRLKPVLEFNFEYENRPFSYELFSANDFPKRDPTTWNVYRKDSTSGQWEVLHTKTCVPTTERFTSIGKHDLCFSDSLTSVKIDILKNNGARMTQLSRVLFYDENYQVIEPASVVNPGGDHPRDEQPRKLLQHSGKWLDRARTTSLIFHFNHLVKIAHYELFTANDFPERDPTQFTVSVRTTGEWVISSSVKVDPPTARHSSYGITALKNCQEKHIKRVARKPSLIQGRKMRIASEHPRKNNSNVQLRFKFVNGGERCTQLSFMKFYDSRNQLVQPTKVFNPRGNSPQNEEAEKILSKSGKWLDRKKIATLIFEFDGIFSVSSYEIFTADDFPGRDPIQWTIEIGVGGNWKEIVLQKVTPPTQRNASYGIISLRSNDTPKESVKREAKKGQVFPPTAGVTSSNDGEYPALKLLEEEARWDSGEFAPQWIQLDLGRKMKISNIQMTVDQEPTGYTRHQIFYKDSQDGEEKLICEVSGESHDGEKIDVFFAPIQSRFVRIHSVESPSRIAWRDVTVSAKKVPAFFSAKKFTSAVIRHRANGN